MPEGLGRFMCPRRSAVEKFVFVKTEVSSDYKCVGDFFEVRNVVVRSAVTDGSVG